MQKENKELQKNNLNAIEIKNPGDSKAYLSFQIIFNVLYGS